MTAIIVLLLGLAGIAAAGGVWMNWRLGNLEDLIILSFRYRRK